MPLTRVTIRQFFRDNGDAAICAMGVIIIGAATNYVWHSYLSVYVERQLHLPLSTALLGAFVSGVLNLFLFPLSGKLADRYGAYRLFYPIVIAWMPCTLKGMILLFPRTCGTETCDSSMNRRLPSGKKSRSVFGVSPGLRPERCRL